jgi:hypothetical protein
MHTHIFYSCLYEQQKTHTPTRLIFNLLTLSVRQKLVLILLVFNWKVNLATNIIISKYI